MWSECKVTIEFVETKTLDKLWIKNRVLEIFTHPDLVNLHVMRQILRQEN